VTSKPEVIQKSGWGKCGATVCCSRFDLLEPRFWTATDASPPKTLVPANRCHAGPCSFVDFSLKRSAYSDVYVLRGLSIPKPDSLQGSLDLLVLKILSRRVRLHGYAIMSAIQGISGEVLRVEEGSLYPALHRMEEAGWIRAQWITKDSGKRARMYELTAAGKKQLGAEESRWQAVTLAVNRVLREA
jgi:transcriptional regulator